MKSQVIKVGYLVSYDWKLLENSIPRIYNDADVIMLALDKGRKTWAGNSFDFDQNAFIQFIQKIDISNKIHLYEDNFYDPSQTTMQNEVRERNMLAFRLGAGGWHIQFDADEYPVNFSSFVDTLRKIDSNPNPAKFQKPVNVSGYLVTIIKKVEGGFICVKPDKGKLEWCPFATQVPIYSHGRRNGHFNILTPFMVIHESRSRSNEEFHFKLKNWGHNQDFDTESYFSLWKAIDGYNFRFIKDFNPIGNNWPELSFVPAQNISDLVDSFEYNESMAPSSIFFFLRNSRNIARMKYILSKLFRL